jgi:hypothetical protein
MAGAAPQGKRRRPGPIDGYRHRMSVSVRYIVDDVDAAIAFYTQHLGFGVDMHPAPGFAMLSRSYVVETSGTTSSRKRSSWSSSSASGQTKMRSAPASW